MTEWDRRSGDPPDASQLAGWMIAALGLGLLIGFAVLRWYPLPGLPSAYPETGRALPAEPEPVLAEIPEPDFDYFPCSDCHEDEPTDPTVRVLEFEHETLELEHGDLWCLHCHAADDRDRLHFADGSDLGFEQSWRLCLQCHGEKGADWRAGVHGKRVGHWWGPKRYEPCTTCHAAHAPRFQPLSPRPPPLHPHQIVWRPPPGEDTEGPE